VLSRPAFSSFIQTKSDNDATAESIRVRLCAPLLNRIRQAFDPDA
jgi:hypothetical protein